MITARTDARTGKSADTIGTTYIKLFTIGSYRSVTISKQCTLLPPDWLSHYSYLCSTNDATPYSTSQTVQTEHLINFIFFIERLAKSTVNKGSDITRRSDSRLPPDRVLYPTNRSIVIRIRIFHRRNKLIPKTDIQCRISFSYLFKFRRLMLQDIKCQFKRVILCRLVRGAGNHRWHCRQRTAVCNTLPGSVG